MKALSRLASPAGFALVLLLFLFLPFISVSCEVPDMGTIGADYSGAQLAVGSEPDIEIPAEMREIDQDAPGAVNQLDPGMQALPDLGVRPFALLAAMLMAAGIVMSVLRRPRARMAGAAGIALLAGVLVVVTEIVAQSNLREDLEKLAGGAAGLPDADGVADMIHTELGFWLPVALLALIVVLNAGVAYREKNRPKPTPATRSEGSPPG